jgi:hypothetical protein
MLAKEKEELEAKLAIAMLKKRLSEVETTDQNNKENFYPV